MIHRLQVYETMMQDGLVPVFYMDDVDKAIAFIQDCIAGGVRVFEFTNRGQQALTIFQQLRAYFPEVILGIGSIVDAPTAALFIAHGANFIVSPVFDADVIKVCNSRKVACIPGCATPTEIHTAHAHGVEIVKLFPASTYGSNAIKAIKAPMPWAQIMPTGGIGATIEDVRPWFEANACCVGIGSSLQQVEDVSRTCQQLLNWIADYRGGNQHA